MPLFIHASDLGGKILNPLAKKSVRNLNSLPSLNQYLTKQMVIILKKTIMKQE